jgi:hypothetical protein
MPIHDWTRAQAWIFHHFHQRWIGTMTDVLNQRLLPEDHWRHAGVLYRDDLVRIVIDMPDLAKNRQWMKPFKKRWLGRLEELELWMISDRIELE